MTVLAGRPVTPSGFLWPQEYAFQLTRWNDHYRLDNGAKIILLDRKDARWVVLAQVQHGSEHCEWVVWFCTAAPPEESTSPEVLHCDAGSYEDSLLDACVEFERRTGRRL